MDRKLEKKKWPPKKIATIAAIVIFIVAVVYIYVSTAGESRLNVEKERITISTVKEGDFQEYIAVMGNLLPIETRYIEPERGGQVEEIYLQAGTMVKKGDPILRLENTDLLINIMYNEGQLFNVENNLRNTHLQMEQRKLSLESTLLDINSRIKTTKNQYERSKELYERGLETEANYEQLKFNYENLLSLKDLTIRQARQDSLFFELQIENLSYNLERMRQNYGIIKQQQENLTIKAPIDGMLTSLNVEVIGGTVRPYERIGQVDVLSGFKVRAEIDEYYLSRIEVGRNATGDFAGQEYTLIVDRIFPEVREGRFNVDLQFVSDQHEGMRQGLTLHLRLELGDLKRAILLPRGGFYQTTGGQWVYVVNEGEDNAIKRDIKLGQYNPEVFEVIEGLKPGDKVITSSYESFGDIDKLILK